MNFPFNLYAGGFLAAAILSWMLLPPLRKICLRLGFVDDPGHRKIHDSPMPLAGGFSALSAIVLLLGAGFVMIHTGYPLPPKTHLFLQHGMDRRLGELTAIVLGAFVVVVTGALDDRFELKPAVKFGGQLLAALIVAQSGVRITLFVHGAVFSYGITILWFLTVINALNFLDNMNGLCAGLGAIGSLCFGLIAAAKGDYLVAGLCMVCAGSLAGFLPHNFPRATAFLGDTGSHLVGYILAVMAVLPHFSSADSPHRWTVLLPLLVLAAPLGDLCFVVLLRWRMGKPFYAGDTNHISHRLVRRGYSKTLAVLLIWLFAVITGGAALILIILYG